MKRGAQGFTVVELVTVMIVVGILAAIAVPRIARMDDFNANAYRNEIASALRHAQKSAVSHRRTVCAALATTTVTLTIASQSGGACNSPYASPDGNPYASRDPAIQASGAFVGQTLHFQPNGDITTDAGGTVPAVGVINVTGQPAQRINIDGRTGLVQ